MVNGRGTVKVPSVSMQEMLEKLVKIKKKSLRKMKEKLNKILAANSNHTVKRVAKDTERDYFMSADEALEYGLIDKII